MRQEGPEERHSGKRDGARVRNKRSPIRAEGTASIVKSPDLMGSRKEGDESERGTRRDTAEATHNYLASVRVGVLSHDAFVVQDVLEGLAGETSARRTHT